MNELLSKIKCIWCDGTGVMQSRDEYGNFMEEDPCVHCNGTGMVNISTISGETLDTIINDIKFIKNKIKKIAKILNVPEDDGE